MLWVHDAAGGPPPVARPQIDAAAGAELWLIANKLDEVGAVPPAGGWAERAFAISAKYGAGLEALTDAVGAFVAARAHGAEHPALIRERHRMSALEAAGHLRVALARWDHLDDELLAEELRLAGRALGRMTGTIGVEDLLDVVFREFCIGK